MMVLWMEVTTAISRAYDSAFLALCTTGEPDRGFEFSGVSPEELHLFDYAAHVKRVRYRLEQITQLHAPPLKLVPTNKVNFLAITDGKPTK